MTVLGYDDIYHYIRTHELDITRINENTIRENGIDCKIGNTLAIDTKVEEKGYVVDTHDEESIKKRFKIKHIYNNVIIPAKNNVLLVTDETFRVPNDVMGLCCLRSTVARNGFVAPITIIDAGFEGTLTIEIWNGGNNPIKIYRGDRFLHVVFLKINSPVSKPYEGVYKGQSMVRLPKCID